MLYEVITFHTVQPGMGLRAVPAAALIHLPGELLQDLLLLATQVHGGFDIHLADQVADRSAAHRFHALATNPEHFSGLGFLV